MGKKVVLLMTDMTRKDMVSCYGNPVMRTPNIDKLAKKGIRYENAYTCQPVCGPARAALFTGTFPHSNGMITNSVALSRNAKTIGERFHKEGIHCGYIGKWHLDGSDYFGNGKCAEGYDPDYWYDMRCYLEELSPEDRLRSRKLSTSFDEDMSQEFTFAHRCSNRAIDFINKFSDGDEDFFLTVSYDEPHGPCVCPAPFNKMFENFKFEDSAVFTDDLQNKPFMQQLWAGDLLDAPIEQVNKSSLVLSAFLGCNSFVDYEIGRVLDVIYDKIPDALVIFTSDHGDMLCAHRLDGKNATAYKEIANIPLIIMGGESDTVVNEVASHIDIVPTIMEYMGVKLEPTLEGKSILPQIYDTSVSINEYAHIEFTRYEVDHDGFGGLQMMRAIVTDRYKLVINLLDTDEFYDLQTDPHEVKNLISVEGYADIRNRMHDALLQHMNDTRDPYRGYQWATRTFRPDKKPTWENDGYTRQRENETGENRQLDYDTGLEMESATRNKNAVKVIF